VPFGAEGWSLTVPALRLQLVGVATDDALPGLDAITDPERGRLLLGECLRANGLLPLGGDITTCQSNVVTHKPGVRATVVCRLEYDNPGSAAPGALVVKVHHDDQGERAFHAMRALSQSSSGVVHLARPIAYVPDLGLSVQEYVGHRGSLKDLFHSGFHGDAEMFEALADAMRATAAGLAGLHRSGCAQGEPVTWDQELATLRMKQDRLAVVMPDLRRRIGSVPDRLASAAAAIPPDPLLPAHHSFRPAQVLLTDTGVTFIDFDKFCQAEPACDIALFTAKLRHMAVNKVATDIPEPSREDSLPELLTTFLDEYHRHAAVSEARVALWEALELTSLVLSAAKKVNGPWVDSCHRMLEKHLDSRGW
jgi:hypothetical protein